MTAKPITSITDGQKKQYRRFVEDAAEKAQIDICLDKDAIQRLIENGGEFQMRIAEAVRELSVSKRFSCEETPSRRGYVSGYRKPHHVAQQIKIIRDLFPDVRWGYYRPDESKIGIPEDAEGLFAIPRWEKIASTYNAALDKVLALIGQTRDGQFCNHREGNTGPNRLRQHSRTVEAFEQLGYQQKEYDILIVPAQFGLLHRGRSVRRAREVFNGSEFGLGAFAVGIMLLTHPERLRHYEDLWVDCAGDDYDNPDDDDRFSRIPTFFSQVDGLRFDAGRHDHYSDFCGSASGFLVT